MSLLDLESVTTSYRRGRLQMMVLRDVSLQLEPGKLVSIYGQRNSGKTALLRIAGGFEQPDSGRVRFAGTDFVGLAENELATIRREKIGWVDSTGPHSAELDVATYVGLPFYGRFSPRRARRYAIETLAAIGIEGCAKKNWDELPDVTRVLCAIVRATIREPELLIADDPTAGLGILDREHVCGVLRGLADNDGIGVLMAVPDMPSMLHAHDVHLLARGRLLAPPATSRDGDAPLLGSPDDRRSA